MEKKIKDNRLYVALPSEVDGYKFIQKPKNITIVNKNEENSYIDFLTNEEIYVFNRDELTEDKKYIRVFNGDLTTLRNYIFSLNTGHIKDINGYMEVLKSIAFEYNQETLEKILYFLREEIHNIEYTKTRKITTAKRRIRKK